MYKIKRYIKVFISCILITAVILTNTGCTSRNTGMTNNERSFDSAEDNQQFNDFTNEIFKKSVIESTISLHSCIENPANYGINDYDITLGRYDLENPDDTSEIVDALNRLKDFNRDNLSSKQQLTYDQLEQYLQTELEYSDLYLFNTCLVKTTGIQVQLPLIFAEYSIKSENDVIEYLALLKDVKDYFQNICDFEKLRSEAGLFMEDQVTDSIIKQCEELIKTLDTGFMVTTFNQRIDLLSSISHEKNEAYKQENIDNINNYVKAGYQLLIDNLKALRSSGKYTGGLCNYPNGKKYYEYLLKKDIGWTKTVDEYNALLDSYISSNISNMQFLIKRDSSLTEKLNQNNSKADTPANILDKLKKHLVNDFPAGPDVSCEISYISDALEDYASPAMYFTPQIDNITSNSIYINKKSTTDSSLFTTLAHEGYPGHMYQMTYFADTKPDLIRYIIEPDGYVEGWATYCELKSYDYQEENSSDVNTIYKLNASTILCLYAKTDIGINYYGWDVKDVSSYLSNFGYGDENIAQEMYDSMISNPGNYCKYVLGYIAINEHRIKASKELGSNFNLKDFHKFILDLGPIQFDIVDKYMTEWINSKK